MKPFPSESQAPGIEGMVVMIVWVSFKCWPWLILNEIRGTQSFQTSDCQINQTNQASLNIDSSSLSYQMYFFVSTSKYLGLTNEIGPS
jgi:hypothetical protein